MKIIFLVEFGFDIRWDQNICIYIRIHEDFHKCYRPMLSSVIISLLLIY